jgi:hypothetical protein
LIASSLPSSSSSKASFTSWVKKVRLTTTVFCALYLKIQLVRGSSSYMGMALAMFQAQKGSTHVRLQGWVVKCMEEEAAALHGRGATAQQQSQHT